jgi:glucan biosynthesis protein C
MSNKERIHGFDALRTMAMWLGVLLHAIIAYKATPEPNWPSDTPVNGSLLNWVYDYIHLFRMPLFFFVAGFFARLVITRSGTRYFVQQRVKRILVPFLVGVVFIVPLTLFPFNFYKFRYTDHLGFNQAVQQSAAQLLHWNGLAHLWFLYYLVIFYALHLLARLPRLRLPMRLTAAGYISPLQLAAAAILLFCILLCFGAGQPPVYTGIKPSLFYLLYYGFFYLAGCVLQAQGKAILTLGRYAYALLLTGTAISVYQFLQPGENRLLLLLLSSVQTLAVTAGITGLFMKYFHRENKLWRYCSDAAYWVYLVHLPVVVSCQVLLLQSDISPALRLPVVLLAGFTLSLVSYQLFVRYTVLGEYLHGKRNKPSKSPVAPQEMALR